jgi:hypothetical protein
MGLGHVRGNGGDEAFRLVCGSTRAHGLDEILLFNAGS